jgi:hypothetical protein
MFLCGLGRNALRFRHHRFRKVAGQHVFFCSPLVLNAAAPSVGKLSSCFFVGAELRLMGYSHRGSSTKSPGEGSIIDQENETSLGSVYQSRRTPQGHVPNHRLRSRRRIRNRPQNHDRTPDPHGKFYQRENQWSNARPCFDRAAVAALMTCNGLGSVCTCVVHNRDSFHIRAQMCVTRGRPLAQPGWLGKARHRRAHRGHNDEEGARKKRYSLTTPTHEELESIVCSSSLHISWCN